MYESLRSYLEAQIAGGVPYVDIIEKQPGITIDDAYRVMLALADHKAGKGDRLIGYKAAYTSKAMQRANGMDEPIVGCLMRSGIVEESTPIRIKAGIHTICEPEIAVLVADGRHDHHHRLVPRQYPGGRRRPRGSVLHEAWDHLRGVCAVTRGYRRPLGISGQRACRSGGEMTDCPAETHLIEATNAKARTPIQKIGEVFVTSAPSKNGIAAALLRVNKQPRSSISKVGHEGVLAIGGPGHWRATVMGSRGSCTVP